MTPFQLTLLAVTTLPDPPIIAFQPPVRCGFSLKVNVMFQPFTVVFPPLLITTSNWYPLPQLLTTFAAQFNPPTLIELATDDALKPTELLLDDWGVIELLDARKLEATELEAIELEAPTIPNGAGCAEQVLREIQLLLFS